MTAFTVIKPHARHASVRPLTPSVGSRFTVIPERDAAADERAMLVGEIERFSAELDAVRAEHADIAEREQAAGYAAGLHAAERQDHERLDLLRHAINEYRRLFEQRVDDLECNATVIAHAALSKLFDQPENFAAMVEGTLRRQLATLRERTVLSIRVSALDFPEAAALGRLAAIDSSVELAADSDLPPGACRVRFEFESIDLDLSEQWGKLSELL